MKKLERFAGKRCGGVISQNIEIQDKSYKQKTIYKLNPTTQTQDNAVLLQTTVMVRCGSLKINIL